MSASSLQLFAHFHCIVCESTSEELFLDGRRALRAVVWRFDEKSVITRSVCDSSDVPLVQKEILDKLDLRYKFGHMQYFAIAGRRLAEILCSIHVVGRDDNVVLAKVLLG